MKITRVDAYALKLPPGEAGLAGTVADAAARCGHGDYYTVPHSPNLFSPWLEAALVRVETSDGVVGWGEAQTPVGAEIVAQVVARLLRPSLLGQDRADTHVLWHAMYNSLRGRGHTTSFALDAMAAVDNALWDLNGRALGEPVYRLLGGAFRTRFPAYRSGLPPGDTETRCAAAVQAAAEGFAAVKLFGGAGVEADAALCSALTDALGDRARLILDVQWRYTPAEAIHLGRVLDSLGVGWFETPVAPEDTAGAAAVAAALDTPVALGECERTPWQFRDLLHARAGDILQPDVGRCGGLTGFRKIAALAEAHHVPLTAHCGLGFGLYIAATLHAMAATPGDLPQEIMPSVLATANRYLKPPIRFEAGALHVPAGPGLGVELDEAVLRPYLHPAA